MFPRAVNPDGSLKSGDDWELSKTLIREGAGLGANSTIRCGVTVGKWAVIGAGSVVTRDVPDYGLVWGNPARLHGFVSPSGNKLIEKSKTDEIVIAIDTESQQEYKIPLDFWERIE